MDHWVAKLREQAAQIALGTYQPGALAFTRAPAGLACLSQDLDKLAFVIADREAAGQAIARDGHHRIKNNLQIVSSLLNLQANRVENAAARDALGQTRARIGALALIHRILYDQADHSRAQMIDVTRLFSELCTQLGIWNRQRVEVAFSCKVSQIKVPLNIAMPIALFAVEAVTNAYAYAFPNGREGTLALMLGVAGDGDARLSITDDGVGFDHTRHDNAMGRQLMAGYADQLDGRFSVASDAASGTRVQLDFSIGNEDAPIDDATRTDVLSGDYV